MTGGEFKKFATFTSLITPQLITASYWLATVLIIVAGTWVWTVSSVAVMAVSLILVRIGFELVMVSFKNNEYLRRICEAAEAKNENQSQR
ncbi:DUF4282 domain-containing protein [Klebsiella sp. WP4-W18-ESBL-05]|uniref:DUF4282 domain-containing protein n=1 Tax=Klebsiella sp. WP4-W18-ESBL-05 TaxID=2675713 RepID=UPI00160145C0|nr:DUF4282 domain-containing protein [Klebsiella sp. WP4-W18-ESBL-05]